jgi:hypothetical protein
MKTIMELGTATSSSEQTNSHQLRSTREMPSASRVVHGALARLSILTVSIKINTWHYELI